MGLQLLCGPSGCGKTYDIYRTCIEQAQAHPKQQYIIIVPEQATLQTQQELIRMHPRRGLMNIDVIGFRTLAYRVFAEQKTPLLSVIDSSGRMMLLRRAIESVKDELTVLKRQATHNSFVEAIMQAISELNDSQYLSNPGSDLFALLQSAPTGNPILIQKLRDLVWIWEAYHKELENRFMDKEEILPLFCKVSKDSQLLANSTIYVDGFLGFAAIQYEVLTHLMLYARELVVSVCLDPKEATPGDEFSLFYAGHRIAERLKVLADKNGVVCYPDRLYGERPVVAHRYHPDLAHLEQFYERERVEAYQEKPQRIRLFAMEQKEKELQMVAEESWRLVREEGYRFSDIAVIAGDPQAYEAVARRLFRRAQIPYFLDVPRNLLEHEYVNYQLSLLQMIEKKMDMESVFSCLKRGYLLAQEEVDILENYALRHPLRGYRRWGTPLFEVSEDESEVSEELRQCEAFRSRLWDMLQDFIEAIGNGKHTAKEYIEALRQLNEKTGAKTHLDSSNDYLHENEMYDVELEYRMIWERVEDLYDQNCLLLGEESFAPEEMREILESGFGNIQLGIVPPTLDRCVIGDLHRTRLSGIKALFMIGVNEGILPGVAEESGIISDRDREFLQNFDLEMALTAKQNAAKDKLYLYQLLTTASEHLYISYALMDMEGKAMSPSYVVTQIRQMFPKLEIEWGYDAGLSSYINPAYAMDYFSEMITKEATSESFLALQNWFGASEEYEEQLSQLWKLSQYHYEAEDLPKDLAEALFGETQTVSASRLEKFGQCPQMHFLEYGLRLTSREEAKLDQLDNGNVYHGALQYLMAHLQDIKEVTGPERIAKKQELVEAAMEYGLGKARNLESKMEQKAWYRYEKQKWYREIAFLYDAIRYQISKGEFEKFYCETSFSGQGSAATKLELSQVMPALSIPGTNCRLQGMIDRIDTTLDGNYFRIIDYKTGDRKMNYGQMLAGVQLQLPLYMAAVQEAWREGENKPVPVGMYYYHLDEPTVSLSMQALYDEDGTARVSEDVEALVREEAYKALRMKGLTNRAVEVAQLQEKELLENEKGYSKLVSNLQVTKDDLSAFGKSVSDSSAALTGEEFEQLTSYMLDKASRMYHGILSGEVQVAPYRDENITACVFCKYKSICHFDSNVRGFSYRDIEKYSVTAFREKIQVKKELSEDKTIGKED